MEDLHSTQDARVGKDHAEHHLRHDKNYDSLFQPSKPAQRSRASRPVVPDRHTQDDITLSNQVSRLEPP